MPVQPTNQIAVYKTAKKLLEFNDRLKENKEPDTFRAHLHGAYSNIGVVALDYTNKSNVLRATANLSPEEVGYLANCARLGTKSVEFSTDKIFGTPDENGKSQCVKLLIRRAEIGSNGEVRNYPWYVEVTNGTGVIQKTQTGGTCCQKGSFTQTAKVFVNLNDMDFFEMFYQTEHYITVWESVYGAKVIAAQAN